MFAEHPGDAWDADDWASYDCYWMMIGGTRVGSCAFWPGMDFDEVPAPECLWVVSVGILPEHQGRGLGGEFLRWQVDFARCGGFKTIVLNTRESNARMRAACEKAGFKVREIVRGYYEEPDESAVVMERSVVS